MSNTDGTPIVGFDLGHGETALARTYSKTSEPPSVLQIPGSGLPGGRQCITAVNEMRDGTVLIGDSAMGRREGRLYLAFKGPQLKDEQVRHPIYLFTKKIRSSLIETADLPSNGAVHWVFGCPSGWAQSLRAEYAALFRAAGFADAEVVTESRAAMLYARDSGEVHIDAVKLNGCVLIVDLGSSTIDFTAVVKRRQRKLELRDRGTNLGASLIEREIMERVLREHPYRQDLEDALAADQNARLRLELLCRKAKEDYFRQDVEHRSSADGAIRADRFETPGGRRVLVDVELTTAVMDSVLDTPLPALGDRSWRQAFREDLKEAASGVGATPDVILLTGGASRMPFVLDIAREMFGGKRVQRGAEPEAAIARGLAIAGRISSNTAGFTADVQRLLNSSQVRELVEQRLPDLAQRVGTAAAEGFTERHVIPAFKRWRSGKITTLNAMSAEIASTFATELSRSDNEAMLTAIADWQNDLKPRLEELTRPICNLWNLPPTALTLPPAGVGEQGWSISPVDRSSAATDYMVGMGGVATGIVAGILSAIIAAHTALFAVTGPVGWVVGIIAGLIVIGNKDKARDKIAATNLPLVVRQMQGEVKVVAKLKAGATVQEAQLGKELAAQFLKKSSGQLAAEISGALRRELEGLAGEAKFLIE